MTRFSYSSGAQPRADEHIELIGSLKKASVIATVSVSESLLKTARGLLAPAIGRRHTYKEFLVPSNGSVDLRGIDLAFCDSLCVQSLAGARSTTNLLLRVASNIWQPR